MTHRSPDIIGNLVYLIVNKNYDPANTDHARTIAQAMLQLHGCRDAMTLLLEAIKQTNPKNHIKTWDSFGHLPDD